MHQEKKSVRQTMKTLVYTRSPSLDASRFLQKSIRMEQEIIYDTTSSSAHILFIFVQNHFQLIVDNCPEAKASQSSIQKSTPKVLLIIQSIFQLQSLEHPYSILKMKKWPNRTNDNKCGFISYYFHFNIPKFMVSFSSLLIIICTKKSWYIYVTVLQIHWTLRLVESFQIPSKTPVTGHLMGTGFLAAK